MKKVKGLIENKGRTITDTDVVRIIGFECSFEWVKDYLYIIGDRVGMELWYNRNRFDVWVDGGLYCILYKKRLFKTTFLDNDYFDYIIGNYLSYDRVDISK